MLFTTACRQHDIALEKVSHTSEYLYCDKVFAEKRKHIVELNEILVQTGTIDTLEDTLARAAVIHVKGKELMLNLVKASHNGDDFEEHYVGGGYQLDLKYRHKDEYNSVNYYG
ncbi:hypothetical protein [Mucilaginibacter straminoryzae]|uniref:hypothetical protein n=1 Tax=Mucilaginibacter straminoryzae TaxID=2932774 RepID=UPI001FD6DB5A|nr:hypothetical protein [Mucilaginibacter straminoryzae]